EPFVDPIERQDVGDQIVDVDLAFHVPIDNLRHVGAPTCTAKRRTFPHPAGNELERARANLLAGAGDPDNHGYTPAAVAALQRLAHHIDIADALKGVVGAAIGEVQQ